MGRYEKTKGSNFETKVAKMICKHFGLDEWQRYLPRTRVGNVYHSDKQKGGQLMGDLHPTRDMSELTGFNFPIECKHRKGWSLSAMMKNFWTSKPYKWWCESQEEISPKLWPFILVFTQNNYPTFVMHQIHLSEAGSIMMFHTSEEDKDSTYYFVELLQDFLNWNHGKQVEPVSLPTTIKKAHKIRRS